MLVQEQATTLMIAPPSLRDVARSEFQHQNEKSKVLLDYKSLHQDSHSGLDGKNYDFVDYIKASHLLTKIFPPIFEMSSN